MTETVPDFTCPAAKEYVRLANPMCKFLGSQRTSGTINGATLWTDWRTRQVPPGPAALSIVLDRR